MPYSRHQRVEPFEDVGVGLRVRQVEHVLARAAATAGRGRAGREQPVGVRAREVGVEVDHLRLDPQPELHAELAHPVDERVAGRRARRPRRRTSRPARRVSSRRAANQPSSSTNRSTPTARPRRPARFSRSRSWSKYTASQVLSTSGRGLRGWPRPRPQVAVEPRRPARRAPRSTSANSHGGAVYVSPGRAAPRPAAAARRRRARRVQPAPSGSRSARCSWLPLQATWTPHTSPCAEAEARRADHQHQRGVVPGAARRRELR